MNSAAERLDQDDTSEVTVQLLPRVRRLFLGLCWLLLAVEVVEWLDADTPVWPDRAVAAAAMLVSVGWLVAMGRRERAGPVLDAVFAGCVLALGWGLGRPGAVLSLLLGGALLRALHGTRRSTAAAYTAMVVAYACVPLLLEGPAGLRDLNLVVVSVALAAFVAVIRQVGEAMARHDLDAVLDDVLAAAAEEMLTATSATEVASIVARGEASMRGAGATADATMLAGRAGPRDAPGLLLRLERLVTDARLVEHRLAGESRFRELAERSRDGIYLRSLDQPDRITWINAAGRRLLAGLVAESDTAFVADFSMVHPDDRAALRHLRPSRGYMEEPVQLRLSEAASTSVEGGEDRWLAVEEHPFSHRDGVVELVQGTVRDVSAQRREEAVLRDTLDQQQQAARRLQELDDLRATFLAAVSHELRTPLAALLGSSQTLAVHRERLSAEQSHALSDAVHRQAGRLQRLLDDLLDVERLTRGRIEARRNPTSLTPLAHATVAALEVDTTSVSVHGEDVVAEVDASQVERIIDNLVRNALKHTPQGTAVRVEIERVPTGARIVVEDDGTGIPPALRTSLFEAFVQGPGADLAASPGTGIGLSLVGKFAQLHGGRAWVEQADGGGARFVVELPDGHLGQLEPERHEAELARRSTVASSDR